MESNIINFKDIDTKIGDIVENFNETMSKDFKNFFEDRFLFSNSNDKLELNIIVDANIILAEAEAYLKYGKSYFLKIIQSPFLNVSAPDWLKMELKKNIPKFSRMRKLDEEKFKNAVKKIISNVKIYNESTTNLNNSSLKKIKERDIADLPYVELYFKLGSHGILTKDKDISDISKIKTWSRPAKIGKIVSVFEKGAFAYFIIGQLPTISIMLEEICILILKGIFEEVKKIMNLLIEASKGILSAILKLPDWIKIIIGVMGILALFWDKSRDFIIETIINISIGLINILKFFYDNIKIILTLSTEGIIISSQVIGTLFREIEETINYYEQINRF